LVGIIGAMALEVERVRALLQQRKCVAVGCTEFYTGKLHGVDAVVADCGVGKVNAALCAQAMLLQFKPKLILNIGVAGGLSPGMKIGDIAIATSVVQHDFNTAVLGNPRGFIFNLKRVNIPCDEKTIQMLLKAAGKLKDIQAHTGVIATGDQFISSQETKEELVQEFGAIACEMEGAAVGQVCALHGVPFGVVRAISDGADDGSPADFITFAKQAADRSAALLLNFMREVNA